MFTGHELISLAISNSLSVFFIAQMLNNIYMVQDLKEIQDDETMSEDFKDIVTWRILNPKGNL